MKDELLRSNNEGNNVGSGVESVLEGFEKIYKRDPEKDGEIKNLNFVASEIVLALIKADGNDTLALARIGADRIKDMANGFAMLAECASRTLLELGSEKYLELRKTARGGSEE